MNRTNSSDSKSDTAANTGSSTSSISTSGVGGGGGSGGGSSNSITSRRRSTTNTITGTHELKVENGGGSEQHESSSEVDPSSELEGINRKSLRIKNNSLNKSLPVTNAATTKRTVQFTNDKSKLNGAQFLSAASLNVNATKLNNTNTNTASSNVAVLEANVDSEMAPADVSMSSCEKSNVDLIKLSQNVDDLNKKLEQHTQLFKKVAFF